MRFIKKKKAVELILEEFYKRQEAISAVSLVKLFESEVNKTTVYRVLDRLENDGTLYSFFGKDGIKWYAKHLCNSSSEPPEYHPHFQCLVCGKIECIKIKVKLPTIPSRKVTSSHILIQGECSNCLAKTSIS
ncbi:Fur family transcriptional regulator [Bernardetia sp.]|uniref:Fur family transcriptional regulator n=1 Tax=Bernardetia sp. TaxID=1937974 RepID=UPI0025B9AC0F|nr:transcriptional repressor [Bernardetia sp.]